MGQREYCRYCSGIDPKFKGLNLAVAAATSGLYYKSMMIVNDDSRVVNKLEASLIDDARVVIYDHHIFIVQATGETNSKKKFSRIFSDVAVSLANGTRNTGLN